MTVRRGPGPGSTRRPCQARRPMRLPSTDRQRADAERATDGPLLSPPGARCGRRGDTLGVQAPPAGGRGGRGIRFWRRESSCCGLLGMPLKQVEFEHEGDHPAPRATRGPGTAGRGRTTDSSAGPWAGVWVGGCGMSPGRPISHSPQLWSRGPRRWVGGIRTPGEGNVQRGR